LSTPAQTGPHLELTVAAVVEVRGRFMVVEERVGGRLVLNQPAGHVEAGESLAAAVIREALEETAWTFVPEATIGVYLWGREGGDNQFLRVAFAGRCVAHDGQRALDVGIERVLWLSRSELVARSAQLRSPMVLRAVDDYERGTRYPVDLFQDLALEQLALRAAVL
jgi:8-oxo-dGTP pyrophosphatase MutT (NUDIX family)